MIQLSVQPITADLYPISYSELEWVADVEYVDEPLTCLYKIKGDFGNRLYLLQWCDDGAEPSSNRWLFIPLTYGLLYLFVYNKITYLDLIRQSAAKGFPLHLIDLTFKEGRIRYQNVYAVSFQDIPEAYLPTEKERFKDMISSEINKIMNFVKNYFGDLLFAIKQSEESKDYHHLESLYQILSATMQDIYGRHDFRYQWVANRLAALYGLNGKITEMNNLLNQNWALTQVEDFTKQWDEQWAFV
jgi:hypothetical protein